MPRRVSLPAADDLFRPTAAPDPDQARPPAPDPDPGPEPEEPAQPASRAGKPAKGPSGRIRHDEKMTVYITSDELLDIEHARLSLRRSQGLAVDRGRLVREAVAIVLADLEARGEDSDLVRRLTQP
ncbi:MAG: hypothetical protein ACXVWU_06230 [Nocardioides sp.]